MKVITSHAFGLHGKVQHRSSERSLSRRKKNSFDGGGRLKIQFQRLQPYDFEKLCHHGSEGGKRTSQPFPLILVLPETNFRLVSKNENLWNLSLKLQGSDFVYELIQLFFATTTFLIISTFSAACSSIEAFSQSRKNKKIFHICWIPAVALWPMANSYSLPPLYERDAIFECVMLSVPSQNPTMEKCFQRYILSSGRGP